MRLLRAFAPASLPALTRGCSLSPSRLRSQTNAGGSASGSPSLKEREGTLASLAGVIASQHQPMRRRGRRLLEERLSFSPLR
jgi:hypothetical protein